VRKVSSVGVGLRRISSTGQCRSTVSFRRRKSCSGAGLSRTTSASILVKPGRTFGSTLKKPRKSQIEATLQLHRDAVEGNAKGVGIQAIGNLLAGAERDQDVFYRIGGRIMLQ
jgi:hypothetical protein